MKSSIRRRLLLWLSPALLLASVAFAVPTYVNVQQEIDELFDKVLQATAYALQYPPDTPSEARLQKLIPPAAYDFDLVNQIWSPDGRRLLTRSHPFLPLPYTPNEGWITVEWRGEPWRVFNLKITGGLVQVGQAYSERRQTAHEIAMHLLAPLLFLLPGLALLVWFGIGRGLQPLRDLADAVEKRTPESLEALPERDLPDELVTLVSALNSLLSRLDQALAVQRRFAADAAHALRSPLTALSLQAQVAERSVDPERQAKALKTLRQGISRASHLVQQLLTLARLDPEAAQHALVPLPLDELTRSVVNDFAPLAHDKGIGLHIRTMQPAVISGDGEALRILLGNLLDNAIRYTPPGGSIDVTLNRVQDGVLFTISDEGPGIPLEERSRVFDRFYRGRGSTEPGSGLGLAIVRRIADWHAADVELSAGDSGQGLRVSVRFAEEKS